MAVLLFEEAFLLSSLYVLCLPPQPWYHVYTVPNPLTLQVFGKAPDHEATSKLPQHGFARDSRWEFLGKSTSEGSSFSVKLDFGLSSESIPEETKALWPYKFALIYSVSLDRDSLNTTLVVTNDGDAAFDFQTLLHTYFKIKVCF